MVELAAVLVLVIGLFTLPGVVILGGIGLWIGGVVGCVVGAVFGLFLVADRF